MAYTIKLTTTATTVVNDLGDRTFTHPTTDLVLDDEFTLEQIFNSDDLQTAIDGGTVFLEDEYDRVFDNSKEIVSRITNRKDWGEYWVGGETDPTALTSGVWARNDAEIISSGGMSAHSVNITIDNDTRMTYTGAKPKMFLVEWYASVVLAISYNSNNLFYVLRKNGVTDIEASFCFSSIKNPTGNRDCRDGYGIVELEENDFVELWIQNNDSGADVANFYVTGCMREI